MVCGGACGCGGVCGEYGGGVDVEGCGECGGVCGGCVEGVWVWRVGCAAEGVWKDGMCGGGVEG